LNTSQPALSRSLRELEGLLGRALFQRGASGLVLTAEGERYRRHVGAALAQIEAGTREARGQTQAPMVRLGLLPNMMRGLAPLATARFKAQSPLTNVRIRWAQLSTLTEELQRGEIDMILGRLLGMEHMSGLSFEQLFTEELIFVAPAGHPLAALREVTLEMVNLGEVVVPLPQTIIRREMDRFLVSRGFGGFDRTVECISFEFTRAYLRKVPAVACLPIGAVRRELASGQLVRLPVAGDALAGPVGITTASGRRPSLPAQRFAEVLRALVASGEHISESI